MQSQNGVAKLKHLNMRKTARNAITDGKNVDCKKDTEGSWETGVWSR